MIPDISNIHLDTLKKYVDADIDFLVEKDEPVIIAFPYVTHGGECKSRKVVFNLANDKSIASYFSFGEINANENDKISELLFVLVIPAVVIAYKGKVLFILSGEEINLQSTLDCCKHLRSILDSAEDVEEHLNKMEQDARKNIIKAGKRISRGSWEMVPLSGIVPGVVMAFSRVHLDGITWLLPTGLAFAVCITNENFHFNAIQKFVATGIMYVIGMYWPVLLDFFRGS